MIIPNQNGTTNDEYEYDGTCPDKEDAALIGQLNQAVQDGLVSTDDASRIYHGRTV